MASDVTAISRIPTSLMDQANMNSWHFGRLHIYSHDANNCCFIGTIESCVTMQTATVKVTLQFDEYHYPEGKLTRQKILAAMWSNPILTDEQRSQSRLELQEWMKKEIATFPDVTNASVSVVVERRTAEQTMPTVPQTAYVDNPSRPLESQFLAMINNTVLPRIFPNLTQF